MKHITRDAMQILAEVSMEVNGGDVEKSFKDITAIDELLGIIEAKSLINHTRGRKSRNEKRFNEVFSARVLEAAEERKLFE